jgi:hypothetical protein
MSKYLFLSVFKRLSNSGGYIALKGRMNGRDKFESKWPWWTQGNGLGICLEGFRGTSKNPLSPQHGTSLGYLQLWAVAENTKKQPQTKRQGVAFHLHLRVGLTTLHHNK